MDEDSIEDADLKNLLKSYFHFMADYFFQGPYNIS